MYSSRCSFKQKTNALGLQENWKNSNTYFYGSIPNYLVSMVRKFQEIERIECIFQGLWHINIKIIHFTTKKEE